jgi:hypothetical protein
MNILEQGDSDFFERSKFSERFFSDAFLEAFWFWQVTREAVAVHVKNIDNIVP